MKAGLRQRAVNYRNDFRASLSAFGSISTALRVTAFNVFSDIFRKSRYPSGDLAVLAEGDLCLHSQTAVIRRFPRTIVRCTQCQVAFALERDSLARATDRHGSEYFLANKDFLYPDGKPDLFNYLMPRTLFFWALGFSAFRPEIKRSLDVGCGLGIMLKYMELFGYEAHGVEISPFAVDHARRELGLERIIQGTIREAAYPASHFSLVTLVHILEHLDDPVPTLQEVYRVLVPGGYAYVEVPSSERDTSDYGIDDHFWFYSVGSLHRLLNCIGFRDVRVGEGTFDKRLHNVPFIFAAACKPRANEHSPTGAKLA
jgi:SAM-dependent methyltransferase